MGLLVLLLQPLVDLWYMDVTQAVDVIAPEYCSPSMESGMPLGSLRHFG